MFLSETEKHDNDHKAKREGFTWHVTADSTEYYYYAAGGLYIPVEFKEEFFRE